MELHDALPEEIQTEEQVQEQPQPQAEPSGGKRHHLEAIMVKRNRFAYANKICYRVYDKPGNFTIIEADSAHEAFAKSGFSSAFKIQREAFFSHPSIAQELLESSGETYEVNIQLPDEGVKEAFIDASTLDAEALARLKPFEEISLGDYSQLKAKQAQAAPVEDTPSSEAAIEQPTAQAQPQMTSELAVQQETATPEVPEMPAQQTAAPQAPQEPVHPAPQATEPEPATQAQESAAEPEQTMPTQEAASDAQPEQQAAAPSESEVSERPLTPEEVNALLGDEGT